jgi:hypothetical protein
MNKTIDWDKFKSKARGLVLLKAKKTYIELCELLNKNNNKLLSEYVNAQTKVLIDFNCGHKPNWITPSNYKQGQSCPKCSGKCSEQAKEDFYIWYWKHHPSEERVTKTCTRCGNELPAHDYFFIRNTLTNLTFFDIIEVNKSFFDLYFYFSLL